MNYWDGYCRKIATPFFHDNGCRAVHATNGTRWPLSKALVKATLKRGKAYGYYMQGRFRTADLTICSEWRRWHKNLRGIRMHVPQFTIYIFLERAHIGCIVNHVKKVVSVMRLHVNVCAYACVRVCVRACLFLMHMCLIFMDGKIKKNFIGSSRLSQNTSTCSCGKLFLTAVRKHSDACVVEHVKPRKAGEMENECPSIFKWCFEKCPGLWAIFFKTITWYLKFMLYHKVISSFVILLFSIFMPKLCSAGFKIIFLQLFLDSRYSRRMHVGIPIIVKTSDSTVMEWCLQTLYICTAVTTVPWPTHMSHLPIENTQILMKISIWWKCVLFWE